MAKPAIIAIDLILTDLMTQLEILPTVVIGRSYTK